MSNPAVVVLTNERDLAADKVMQCIADRGVQAVRLNIEDAISNSIHVWRPDEISDFVPGAVWWRQFELSRGEAKEVSELDELLVVRAQWRAWVACLHAPGIPWMNDLWAGRCAENKVEQLRLAYNIGFNVPETMVTNSLTEALSLGDPGTLVVKSIASAYFELTDEAFVYTHRLDSEIFEKAARWNAQPVVVQRMIDGLNVRVIMIEGQGFGASCEARGTDWRLAPESVEWRPWIVPSDVARLCQSYMDKLGLRFAAFDFMYDGQKSWFLEANQAGEWAFIDRPLSLGIAEAITSSLIGMATKGG